MRKKLLMVIPNLGLGGAQRVFHDHSVELSKYYGITEAVFNLDLENLYPSGNPLESLAVVGGGGPVRKVANFFKRVSQLKQLKKRLKTDICISHLEGADYVNLLSKGQEKIILLIHGSKSHDRNISGPTGWLRKSVLMPLLYKRADRIVCVSRDIIPEMVEDYGVERSKLSAINNSFEVESVWEKAQEPLPPSMQSVYDAAPVLVTSGRLATQKNQQPLLDIFAGLLHKQIAKLVFIGDGELRNQLVAHARHLGLRVYEAWADEPLTTESDVYFVGLQHNPFQFIRPATAFVFPSAWEGFPLALGEAMTCGVPVVSTDCPTGPREMLAPQSEIPTHPIKTAEWAAYGVLMPMLTDAATAATDQQTWIQTLQALLQDESRRKQLGEAARRRSDDFTHAVTFQRWRKLIDEVLAE
ncbi:glycosyltransferase [Hymenobacter defluvii]|uniref:Glycosyltransferase n=1 Tax=Hymenobacter defluvii TaxID=2054411 RepID=A0ABS3TFP4_9BACT|nr:glycosyltransferase [Hymenobacter defluvii]MBO3272482.1 glycosyltransferase [Hymenobacter defluvii]